MRGVAHKQHPAPGTKYELTLSSKYKSFHNLLNPFQSRDPKKERKKEKEHKRLSIPQFSVFTLRFPAQPTLSECKLVNTTLEEGIKYFCVFLAMAVNAWRLTCIKPEGLDWWYTIMINIVH